MISHSYQDIISVQNLLQAWQVFLLGKKSKKDVSEFSLNLSQNIFGIHNDLKYRKYTHGSYVAFSINDPKPRNIHKALVRDRLVHHAIYKQLYPCFEKKFIFDSYSCQYLKGTHRAINCFRKFYLKVSKNNTQTCWVLKCDIKKFFASIDQEILLKILETHIGDEDIIILLKRVIESFQSTEKGKGLPLGNLTSQLLVNIYMNEFDQWMKHVMKAEYYIRYADDFVILSTDKNWLLELTPKIADFLEEHLKLSLHPDKVFIKTFASGVDFLGWVHFPHHRVLRTSTKRRMLRNLKESDKRETIASYRGMLKHGNTYKLGNQL